MTGGNGYSPNAVKVAQGFQASNADEQRQIVQFVLNPASIPSTAVQSAPKKTSWTMAELYDTDFPEPNWVVPGVIPEGLVALGGRPKVGKSRLLLQLAGATAMGGMFLGRQVTQGTVLYITLEDSPRLIRDRAGAMGIPRDAPIEYEFIWNAMQHDGLDLLDARIGANAYRLVALDTLARATPGVNHTDEQPIGRIMERLHDIATWRGTTIVTNDHTRKSNGAFPDPIDDLMGSTSKSRPLDAVLAIYKEQGKAGAVLRGRGREIPDFEEALSYDFVTGAWQSNGDAGDYKLTIRRKEIIEAVTHLGKAQQRAIMEYMGENYPKDKANFYKELADLVSHGRLFSETIDKGVYYYVQK